MAAIGIDATYISVTGKGVSRYQHGFINGLAKIDKENDYYIFLNKKNILPELPNQTNFHYLTIPISKKIFWDQIQLPWLLQKYKLDTYHCVSDTLPLFSKAKFILFIFEIPDYRIALARRSHRNSLYAWVSQSYSKSLFRKSLKKAKAIIASSQSTKDDLMQMYGIEEKKISIIYPASDEYFHTPLTKGSLINTRKKYNAEQGYILNIASSDPRDNTAAVIRVFQKVQTQLKLPKKLMIYGDVGFKKNALKKLINEFNLGNDIIFVERFTEKEAQNLATLYQGADLYIDPSLYEGFGFQILEAMACGVPVITSNNTSLPEIVADAGILVNPLDIEGLVSAVVKVFKDPALSQFMRQKSFERARLFSWEQTTRKTLEVFGRIIP